MAFKFFCFLALFIHEIAGHGYMIDPPGRSSLWRFFDTALKNYNDNANFCGGFAVSFTLNFITKKYVFKHLGLLNILLL